MGGNTSQSTSTPLNAKQRAALYQQSIASLFQNQATSASQYLPGEYQPAATTAGTPNTLTGQDYDTLQADTLAGSTAGLDYAKNLDTQNVNNDAAERGIWSSGLAMQGEKDVDAAYAPQYEKAGADATSLRYNLQSGENQNLNQYQLANTALANTQAQQQYESQWRPADYLAGLWNGTGGITSSGSSSGWSI